MSAEKKVFLLFLSLIVLMAVCVYTQLDKRNMLNDTRFAFSMNQASEESKEEVKKDEETNTEENKSNEEQTEVATPVEQTETSSETASNTDEAQGEQSTSLDANAQEPNVEEEPVEEVVEEEPIEPLITTDKRYTRTGSEKNIEELSLETQELQIKLNDYVKQNPIIFKRASNKITNKSNKTIKTIVKELKENASIKIEVAGHTDAVGAAKLNQAISLERAKSVRARLIFYGIKKDRINVRGYGEDIPLVKNSPGGYSKVNRRVEFNIVEE